MHEDLGASLRRRKWVLWLMGRARWARTCSLWARSDSRRRALLAGDSLLFFGLTECLLQDWHDGSVFRAVGCPLHGYYVTE